ncbi:hypothetical protein CBF34_03755 [Vagococcus penaei]|uniref:Flavodoxin-like fold domain-containing protein n=1 Tax=Vagococcus penaei TaxID=633807 RepID=A0A1Q2D8E6_9ENTE|nr:NAD(P)H-dependent oxidoreductase [Vagococcus penaei]AQP54654.1 hypothetical protein BW732_10850 [Vagococcus penaei]RSU05306.1 hypothetical protein CBF34_03755 [Vagococcus penaei]
MKTIIYAHPWEGSYNHAILERVTDVLTRNNLTYQVIDLYADKFDPVYHASELKEFSQGTTPYSLIKDYQKMIQDSDGLIFIFPIWWYSTPGILKGFLDKVFLKNFAYTETKSGIMTGQLTNIKSVKVITTGQAPKWYIRLLKGDGIRQTFIKGTLKAVGMKHIKWIHEGMVVTSSRDKKQTFLQRLDRLF